MPRVPCTSHLGTREPRHPGLQGGGVWQATYLRNFDPLEGPASPTALLLRHNTTEPSTYYSVVETELQLQSGDFRLLSSNLRRKRLQFERGSDKEG